MGLHSLLTVIVLHFLPNNSSEVQEGILFDRLTKGQVTTSFSVSVMIPTMSHTQQKLVQGMPCLIKQHEIYTCGRVKVCLHITLITALDGRPGRFIPGKTDS
jgi:hypothetical protein